MNQDGSEDPTAELHGYGRLWIEPHGGGRISEFVPGLTDYEASGGFRKSLSRGEDYVAFIIDTKPFAKDLHDTTYGGARINVGFINFDRDHEATFAIGERTGTDFWGGTLHSDRIEVTVPPGSVRQVAVPLLFFVGPGAPPIFPYDTPLQKQVFMAGRTNGGGMWAAYATLIDGTTAASTFFFDSTTDTRQ